MIQILLWALLCSIHSFIFTASVTFHNKTKSIIDISAQSYATLAPFKELLCYIDDIKPNQIASCHIPDDRCLGAVFIHSGATIQGVRQFKIDPANTCRDFEFTITEQNGLFFIQE